MSILDTFSLQGKVALVTGGAGRYGRQITAALAEAGARTYIAARNLDRLEALAAKHRAEGHDVRALPYDQGEEASILALRDAIVNESGHFDILVNNAVLDTVMRGYQAKAETFAESMRVNATGLFIITRAFGDVMATQGSGSIINIGSMYGLIVLDPTIYVGTNLSGWNPDYFFHKGGMVNFTRFIASYYGAQSIRCNCICAGGLQNDGHPERFVRQFSERTLLGRMANSTDLMGIVVFLASEASAYITGTNISVDGGFTAK